MIARALLAGALVSLASLVSPGGARAQDAECNRVTLDLFDASRRSRTALEDMLRVSALFDEAMVRYDEEIPSGPGFLGAAFVVDSSDLGQVPVCAADGTSTLSLNRLRRAGLGRWDDADGEYGVRFMYVTSDHALNDVVRTDVEGEGGSATEVTSRSALTSTQSYVGARVITPYADVTAGVIQVDGVRAGVDALGLAGAEETGPEPLGVHLRVGVPVLSGLTADVVFGGGLSRLETAVFDLRLPLPYEATGDVGVAWLYDESRAVLRLGVTDPWEIFSADVGFETSTAVFRHGRLRGRYVSRPLMGFDPESIGLDRGWARVLSGYIRLGVDAEVSRFSGRHFEDVNGATGVNGYAVQVVLVTHMLLIPVRMEMRAGGGRNRVELMEHAVAFADRGEFLMHAVVSIGW